jgi:hypothetical protein
MYQAHSMLRQSLLAAVCTLVVVASRPAAAQPPTTPDGRRLLRPDFQDPDGRPAKQANPLEGFDLRLMAPVNDIGAIPTTGKKLIILAVLGQELHFRIFDVDGTMVVDEAEGKPLPPPKPPIDLNEPPPPTPRFDISGLDSLKKQLKDLWPPHQLTADEKVQVVATVSSIVDLDHARREKRRSDFSKRFEAIMAKLPVQTGPVDKELQNLLIARRDSAVRRLKMTIGIYEEGRITLDKFCDSMTLALKSQLDLFESPADQVPIYELLVEFAKEVEERALAEVDVARGTEYDVEAARFYRINCEIDLLRAKRKLAKK